MTSPQRLTQLLQGPWSDELRDAIESTYKCLLRRYPMNGTPGPFVVDYSERAETFQPVLDFFPELNPLPLEYTGFTHRDISVRRKR